MGFPPETVALAYDKTVFYKKELNWRYLNGILRRWHQQEGTVEQVEAGQQRDEEVAAKPAGKTDWMDSICKGRHPYVIRWPHAPGAGPFDEDKQRRAAVRPTAPHTRPGPA